jgi:hypothetical protein
VRRRAGADPGHGRGAHRCWRPRLPRRPARPGGAGRDRRSPPRRRPTDRVIVELADKLDRIFTRREAHEGVSRRPSSPLSGEILVSLPGIGPRTSARVLAESGTEPASPRRDRLRRPGPGHPPVPATVNAETRNCKWRPPAQERHVPRRVRREIPHLQSLLRP